MKLFRNIMVYVLFCALFSGCTPFSTLQTQPPAPVPAQPEKTAEKPKLTMLERYKDKIIYVDFWDLPLLNIDTETKIELPTDLKAFLDKTPRGLPLRSPKRLEQEFLEEMGEINYSLERFAGSSYQTAIFTVARMVASRIKYGYPEKWFYEKFGRYPSIDESFYIGGGDCDKYQNLTILAWKFFKKADPHFQNIYMGPCELGGNLVRYTRHAWNSIIIPQKNYLILSHVDPTHYDVHKTRKSFQADNYHVRREYNGQLIIASFYCGLGGEKNLDYAYDLFKNAYDRTPGSNRWLKEYILDNLAYTAYIMLYNQPYRPPDSLVKNYMWILNEYERYYFRKHHDYALFYAYLIFNRAGNETRANFYKEQLHTKYPGSTLNQRIH